MHSNVKIMGPLMAEIDLVLLFLLQAQTTDLHSKKLKSTPLLVESMAS